MCLLLTALAAVVTTIVWYVHAPADKYKVSVLCMIYWGATLMWCVDGIACLIEGEQFIETQKASAVADDALLGFTVIVCGMIVWTIALLIKDPKNVLGRMFTKVVAQTR